MLVPSCVDSPSPPPSPSPKNAQFPPHSPIESQWLANIRGHPIFPRAECPSDFDLLRWAHAYKGDIDVAVRKYRRHVRIREILRLDECEHVKDGLDELADDYAPMDILGQVSQSDGRILLFERTGRFHLEEMMKSIRTSSFMANRFRLMERILAATRQSEKLSGRRQSALLVMDLEGMHFHAGLVSFISGPYRILWGTLVEQYPCLLSSILVLNCPPSISVLWSACATFIGDDYAQRVHLLGRDWRQKIGDLLPLDAMPVEEYGGARQFQLRDPQPCRIPPLDLPSNVMAEMEVLSIPAGEFLVRTYYLDKGDQLQFMMGHDQELTMNMAYSDKKRLLQPAEIVTAEVGKGGDGQNGLEEVFAGCERPGMPNMDSWRWRVPRSGFFHLALGNEKAWILPVSVRFQLFQVHPNGGHMVRVQPIPAEHLLRAEG